MFSGAAVARIVKVTNVFAAWFAAATGVDAIDTAGRGLTLTVTLAEGARALAAAAPVTVVGRCVVRKTRAVLVSSVVTVRALSDPLSAEN